MSNLNVILERLVRENLHGPVDQGNQYSIKYQAIRQAAAARKKAELKRNSNNNNNNNNNNSNQYNQDGLYYQQLDEDGGDLDSRDPRWKHLFHEFFLSENSDDKNDDLLFFVQRLFPESENGGNGASSLQIDPVFVKRKVKNIPGSQPILSADQEAVILWKDTFFLNVIVQLPCKLTVAVCSRVAETNPITGITKTNMTCTQKHVSKRVYALPTKSRVDVKEATVECSWPNIYYVIDDYEDMFEQVLVRDNEYLCVELAVSFATLSTSTSTNNTSDQGFPTSPISKQSHRRMSHGAWAGNDGGLQPGKPFPSGTSRGSGGGSNKITLFQGAAGFSNLLGIYQQKASSKLGRKFKFGQHTVPTEFVMMRGPGGRGHAQVAITASNLGEEPQLANDVPSSPARVLTSNKLGQQQKQQQGPSSPISKGEKSLPPIPGANGHATVGHTSRHQNHHRPKPLQPPKIETDSFTDSPSSPTSPSHSSFSARTIFNSLRKLSLAAVTQAASFASTSPTGSSVGENGNDGHPSHNQYNNQYNGKPTHSFGSDNSIPSSPTHKRPLNPASSNSSQYEGGNGIGSTGVGSRQEVEALVKNPQSLKCCMTNVNVPWTGIATLLMDYAYSNIPSNQQ
ncbi:hypothetical protein BGZ76_009957 [Entomortierella beljakovae]|nr:hypothetical protein BGZ76_009957 [Entomortierella beljakovae]